MVSDSGVTREQVKSNMIKAGRAYVSVYVGSLLAILCMTCCTVTGSASMFCTACCQSVTGEAECGSVRGACGSCVGMSCWTRHTQPTEDGARGNEREKRSTAEVLLLIRVLMVHCKKT